MERVLFCVLAFCIVHISADTPANCTYSDTVGSWTFSVGGRGHDKSLNCTGVSRLEPNEKLKVELYFPDVVFDQYGNKGWWTLIYNQGFEVVISGRKYFAFFNWASKGGSEAISICNATRSGWSHDVFGRDWACFTASRDMSLMTNRREKMVQYRNGNVETENIDPRKASKVFYRHNPDFINKINSVQKSWKAVRYPEYENYTVEQMIRRAGGRKSKIRGIPRPTPVDADTLKQAQQLPDSWDWRNVNGVNYVSPIRNQGACGSCYAFASMAMNEARIRVMTKNTQQPVFSPQDIVECSEYSQGCEGGFPYLIGGKYAEDFGLVEEKCNMYKGRDGKCTTDPKCGRHYSTSYRYIGGFYGACNEHLMKIALVKNGPIAVSFEVYNDLMHYKSGIYHHIEGLLGGQFNPFEITNHVVIIVGYGFDEMFGQPFWIVKNSWGSQWGEEGFFRIRRGNDECAMESMAVESSPII